MTTHGLFTDQERSFFSLNQRIGSRLVPVSIGTVPTQGNNTKCVEIDANIELSCSLSLSLALSLSVFCVLLSALDPSSPSSGRLASGNRQVVHSFPPSSVAGAAAAGRAQESTSRSLRRNDRIDSRRNNGAFKCRFPPPEPQKKKELRVHKKRKRKNGTMTREEVRQNEIPMESFVC